MPERMGALEQDMNTVMWRTKELEEANRNTPVRLTQLEQQFAFLAPQLKEIKEGQIETADKIDKMSGRIAYGLGACGVIIALLNWLGPALLHIVSTS